MHTHSLPSCIEWACQQGLASQGLEGSQCVVISGERLFLFSSFCTFYLIFTQQMGFLCLSTGEPTWMNADFHFLRHHEDCTPSPETAP